MMKSQRGYAIVVGGFSSAGRNPAKLLRTAWAQLKRWYELDHQRRVLAMLSDAALKDIGISRVEVVAESERPFWDDPLKR